jgi:hypothetical protein
MVGHFIVQHAVGLFQDSPYPAYGLPSAALYVRHAEFYGLSGRLSVRHGFTVSTGGQENSPCHAQEQKIPHTSHKGHLSLQGS